MSGLAFVTHPSVRIKGSENVYTPVQCMDQNCPIKAPHLHCPFCVKTDVYQDPVILKAHYRVKHVDKGIEFAGLKILRCCDHCDIVGVIKGEKKFKGAHWHCYRCRNGFNRRDEAIKHYKTHFRNPQTTFQISITQDLNTPVQYNPEKRGDLHSSDSNPSTCITTSSQEVIHPALTQAVSCISSPITVSEHEVASSTVSMSNGKLTDGALHVSIAANETIDAEEDDNTQTIMIIQEEQLDSSQMDSAFPTHIIANENVGVVGENRLYVLQNVGHKMGGSDKFRGSLVEECQRLQEEKMILKSEVEELHKHIQNLEEELILSKKREEELMARLCNASERGVQEVLQQLESEHRALLHRHLDHLQQTIFASRSQSVLQLTDSTGQEIQVVNAASLEAFLAGNMTTSPTISSTGDHNHIPSNSTTIITAEELELEQVSINHSTAVEETIASKTSNTIGGTTNYIMCVQNVKTEDRGDSEVGTTIEVNPEEMLTNADEERSVAEEDEPQIKRQKLQCS